jgi:hypothetical protein
MPEEIITTEARRVGEDVRNYVRDRFTPGSLDSLDHLADFVSQKVAEVARKTHGEFLCKDCFTGVVVEHVRCSTCANHS